MRTQLVAVAALLGVTAVAGCVTPKQLRRSIAEQRTALEAERRERMVADSQYAAELGAVSRDVATLRSDLQSLRSEYGAKIAAMENGVKVTFPVNFAFDDATVRSEDQPAVERFAEIAQKHFTGAVITIEGFADPAGTQAYNLALSRRRAEAVRAMLVDRGLGAAQVRTVGYGKTRLVVPGAWGDEPGAEQNRRVVFVIETKGEPAMRATL
ncbi:MAG TPA: OmpA family protein [Gemmatimonadaceae bacterium]|jgi:peptidoglycan-associated lipoprotein|nr:OmpA family protein [Gemmatimonadaceae bacterium]